jgi:hypothetical protein
MRKTSRYNYSAVVTQIKTGQLDAGVQASSLKSKGMSRNIPFILLKQWRTSPTAVMQRREVQGQGGTHQRMRENLQFFQQTVRDSDPQIIKRGTEPMGIFEDEG